MWRLDLSNGRTVWMLPGDAFNPRLDVPLRLDWLDSERFVIHWPVGDTTYPYEFKLGRFAL